jgi:sulfur carrier protein
MELKINNQTKQFTSDSLTVQTLLDLEILKQNGIAIAINNYPKTKLAFTLPQRKDILIISATQGG